MKEGATDELGPQHGCGHAVVVGGGRSMELAKVRAPLDATMINNDMRSINL